WLADHHRRGGRWRRAEQRHLRRDVGAQRHEVRSLSLLDRAALGALEVAIGVPAPAQDVADLPLDRRAVLAPDPNRAGGPPPAPPAGRGACAQPARRSAGTPAASSLPSRTPRPAAAGYRPPPRPC